MSVGHEHGRHCYWDHLRCGWVCALEEVAAPLEVPEPAAAAEDAPGPAPHGALAVT